MHVMMLNEKSHSLSFEHCYHTITLIIKFPIRLPPSSGNQALNSTLCTCFFFWNSSSNQRTLAFTLPPSSPASHRRDRPPPCILDLQPCSPPARELLPKSNIATSLLLMHALPRSGHPRPTNPCMHPSSMQLSALPRPPTPCRTRVLLLHLRRLHAAAGGDPTAGLPPSSRSHPSTSSLKPYKTLRLSLNTRGCTILYISQHAPPSPSHSSPGPLRSLS
jgi:hypothetical protein